MFIIIMQLEIMNIQHSSVKEMRLSLCCGHEGEFSKSNVVVSVENSLYQSSTRLSCAT